MTSLPRRRPPETSPPLRRRQLAVLRVGLAAVSIAVLLVLLTDTRTKKLGLPFRLSVTNCTQTLSPGANIAGAVTNAAAGSVICLNGGTYGSTTIASSHGTAGAPITVTSNDYTNPAILAGRLVIDGTGNYITITRMVISWVAGNSADAVALSADHVNLTHDEINGGNTICINPTDYAGSGWTNGLIDHVLIHHCLSDTIHTQGIYTNGSLTGNDTVSNNWCYDVAARCYQMRGGHNIVWHNNTADDANYGALFGNSAPSNNEFYNNIIGPHPKQYSTSGYGAGGSIYVALTNGGTGNSAHDNCLYGPIVYSTGTIATSNNTITSVQFVDAANRNYNLTNAVANAACQSYQVQGGNPGVNGGRAGPPPPPPPAAGGGLSDGR